MTIITNINAKTSKANVVNIKQFVLNITNTKAKDSTLQLISTASNSGYLNLHTITKGKEREG
jgi:hypothetical protein